MAAGRSTWTEVSASPYEWERDALAFVRERFPDGPSYRAWTNFEFIDHDGSIHEVDLLVFSPRGAFLVEIKSWPERTEGDGGTWTRRFSDGRRRALDNPRLLANSKAKRLKSLLENALRSRGERSARLPFLESLVFLSHPQIKVDLNPQGRTGVCVRDPDTGKPAGGIPGIVDTLTTITERDKSRRNFRPFGTRDAERFSELLDAVGIRETDRHRRVGEWLLGELIEEGEGWQEFAARRADAVEGARRVRIFGAGTDVDRRLLSAAARREFQVLEPIEHPGIQAPRDLIEAERGPALLYTENPAAVRLDHFLTAASGSLSIDTRITIVRQLGEALAYAHARGLTHRGLKPSSVLVIDPDADELQVQIRDWHVAHRQGSESAQTGTLTAHADLLIEEDASIYLAPEASRSRNGAHLDVFSLGAIAFQVFTDRPPAPSLIEREAHLRQHGGLDISAVVDGAGETQRLAILDATCPQVTSRTDSVKTFLENIDDVEEELTSEAGADVDDPTSAVKGELLAGYTVKRRLGRGGTAIAYLVEAEGEDDGLVLKVAATPKNNDRIRDEGEVLSKLSNASVVSIHQADLTIGGHAALLIDSAGDQTLAERIRESGPPGLELLERWGEDLIRAVADLEAQGIAHRDIKPDNVGVRKRPPKNQLRLMLFDFSLSRAPIESLSAGTPDYIDPFLRDPSRGRWDLAAERWALAITLHELATGQLPRWGDGVSDPATSDARLELEEALFDPGVSGPLCRFFSRALARAASDRFDSAEDMLRAWRGCFSEASSSAESEADLEAIEAGLATAITVTPVGELPLSARARSALRGAGILTAADLIASSAFELRSLTGVGAQTRDEILFAYERLRSRLNTEELPDVQSLDKLAEQLVPTKSWDARDLELLRAYLGLAGAPWRPISELATESGRSRVDANSVVARGRERWYKTLKSVRRLCDEIADQLASTRLLPIPMLEEAILATRGAASTGEERRRVVAACLRAAIEAEAYKEAPRFALARKGEVLVVADTSEPGADAALEYLLELGAKLESLVAETPAPVERLGEELAAVEPPVALVPPPTRERLCRLAAQASARVFVNDRGEAYPADLNVVTAIEFSAGSLIPSPDRTISINQIEERLRARYPAIGPLPSRPDLDDPLEGIGLEWDSAKSGYGAKTLTSSATRFTHGSTTDIGDEGNAAFERRLERDKRRFLALTAYTHYTAQAERRIGALDGISTVSLDKVFIRHMRDVAREKGARWEAIVEVDGSGSNGRNWQAIQRLANEAAERTRKELLEKSGTLLVTDAGLLARYGQMDLLHEIRRQLDAGERDYPLEGLWLLLPTDKKDERPMIDQQAVPVQDSNEWTHVPRQWILAA